VFLKPKKEKMSVNAWGQTIFFFKWVDIGIKKNSVISNMQYTLALGTKWTQKQFAEKSLEKIGHNFFLEIVTKVTHHFEISI
jgi:hypothetical protein